MDDIRNILSPPQRLAIAYAPAKVRTAFSLLLAFDGKLRDVVANTGETLIGQLKLAWWREAIAAEPKDRPGGEPLLRRLSDLEYPDIRPELDMLVTAWEELLLDGGDGRSQTNFANHRGAAIFGGFVRLIGIDIDVADLGRAWALADLGGDRTFVKDAPRLPPRRALRPLTILALSVRAVSGSRLILHALTGH